VIGGARASASGDRAAGVRRRVAARLGPDRTVGPGGSAARDRPGRRGLRPDDGNAVVEFVFLGVLLLVPLMYLVLAVSTVQRNLYAVTQAAREAGRAYATGTAANATDRARYAALLALQDQGLDGSDVVVSYAAVDAGCGAATEDPGPVAAGVEFAICIRRPLVVPAVPRFLVGRASTVTGRFVVHLDEYRDYGLAAGMP
jgi:Flp pilus assembly protein TadG